MQRILRQKTYGKDPEAGSQVSTYSASPLRPLPRGYKQGASLCLWPPGQLPKCGGMNGNRSSEQGCGAYDQHGTPPSAFHFVCWGRQYPHLHCTDEETETREANNMPKLSRLGGNKGSSNAV